MELTSQVEALPVPSAGEVLFVLRVPGNHTYDELQICMQQLREAANKAAPGRSHAVILAGDIRLEALSEADLQGLGLQVASNG